jgi:hypothetical protein
MALADTIGKFEPLRSNSFRFFVDEVGGIALAGRDQFEMAVKSLPFPSESNEELEIGAGNERIYYASRAQFEMAEIVCRDFVDAATYAFIKNWRKKVYDPVTSRVGYKSEYSGTARVQQFDPNNNVIREWKYKSIWPQTLNPGQGDQDGSDQVEINVSFRYDKVIATIY